MIDMASSTRTLLRMREKETSANFSPETFPKIGLAIKNFNFQRFYRIAFKLQGLKLLNLNEENSSKK